ncbi:MAG: transglutaminaseTgpA domain-containing protein [bacterium]
MELGARASRPLHLRNRQSYAGETPALPEEIMAHESQKSTLKGILYFLDHRRDGAEVEHSIPLRAVTYLAVAIGIFVSAYYNALYAAMFVGIGGITAGYTYSYFRRMYTNTWMKAILTLGILAVGFNHLSRMLFSMQDHILVLTEMLIYLQVLHSFDLPRRKDLIYSILSAFMMICVGGVLSRTMLFGLFLIAFIAIALWMLILYHLQETGERSKLVGQTRPLARLHLLTLCMLALAFPLFFLLIPRFETHAFSSLPVSGRLKEAMSNFRGEIIYPSMPSRMGEGGGQTSTSQRNYLDSGDAYFGFTSSINLNNRGRMSDKLVMRVRSTSANYYRGMVFEHYNGTGWEMLDLEGEKISSTTGKGYISLQLESKDKDAGAYLFSREIYQTVFVEADMPNIVYTAYLPVEMYFPMPELVADQNLALRAAVPLWKGTAYTVVSRVPDFPPGTLAHARAMCSQWLAPYCDTTNVPPSIRRLAEIITHGVETPYEQAIRIRSFLVENYKYDLSIPPAPRGADPVEHFLFAEKKGYCEHFSSAFVLLARSAGIPARWVTGFNPGHYNPLTGYFEIYGTNAHAWAEIYLFPVGWVTFEATPSGPGGAVFAKEVNPLNFFLDRYFKTAGATLRNLGVAALGTAKTTLAGHGRLLLLSPLAAAGLILLLLAWRAGAAGGHGGSPTRRRVFKTYHSARRFAERRYSLPPSRLLAEMEELSGTGLFAQLVEIEEIFNRARFSEHPITEEEARRAEANRKELSRHGSEQRQEIPECGNVS